jgi:hypothetical protein
VHNKKLILIAAALAAACAHQPPPPSSAEPSVTQPPQTVTPPPPAPPEGVEEPVAAPVKDDTTVVITPGGHQKPPAPRLGELAAAERERRLSAPPPVLVVDDKTLAAHATGSLTESKPSATPAAAASPGGPDEGYWRDRVRTLREEWATAVDSIQELQDRAAELRTRFYATDDPYVRDAQVKPAWDQVLGNLDAAKQRAREMEQRLDDVLEEGRLAGALPGWLREGIDLEPKERPYEPPPRKPRPGEPADGELSREPQELDEG